MVNDALDLFSTKDSDIFIDMLNKLGTGSDINKKLHSMTFKRINVTFDSHLGLACRR